MDRHVPMSVFCCPECSYTSDLPDNPAEAAKVLANNVSHMLSHIRKVQAKPPKRETGSSGKGRKAVDLETNSGPPPTLDSATSRPFPH